MVLSDLLTGESGIIVKVKGHGAFRKRILEMGFVKGKQISVIKNAPLRDPVEYKIMDYKVSLRRSEAALIEVVSSEHPNSLYIHNNPAQITISDDQLKLSANIKVKEINVALVGNPNCGKTTLFNYASGAKEHVGNYSGVTVDSKTARMELNGYTIFISDLPGTYSISAYSPEELYVRDHIFTNQPDVVINVLDASNLERNLYLTTQLIDMDIKVVAALNMYDDLQKKGDLFNFDLLGKMIGIPFIPTVSSKGRGITELFEKVIDVYEERDPIVRHIHINYGTSIESGIAKTEALLIENQIDDIAMISPRFLAIKLLENDIESKRKLSKWKNNVQISSSIATQINKIEKELGEDTETIITDAKYGFIAGGLKETYRENPQTRVRKTEMIDAFITHKLFGFPIFIFFMWVMFETTFKLGSFPMDWINHSIAIGSDWIKQTMADGPLKDLLVDGIIGGVGGVIVFLPNILILFFFISFMEDTGYMARAAFIMDKLMHKLGLHGKSFIPLLMGFGCNVPAIMATRTIEDRNSRLLTMLINPFMSCSARLPVYILILGAFFPEHAGTMLFLIYALGIVMAILIARILKKVIIKNNDVPFVMELPPYRMPTLKSTLAHMWNKGQQYLQKMGGIILIASIIIWFLGYFPRNHDQSTHFQTLKSGLTLKYEANLNSAHFPDSIKALDADFKKQLSDLNVKEESIRQKNSFIGRIGQLIEPVLKPMGFDWKMGVSLISGIAAKEIVISTMSVLYQANDQANGDSNGSLITQMRNDKYENGDLVFTPWAAISFILFTLIYFPCLAVIAAIKKESGTWKWPLFTILYTTFLACFISFVTYQVGTLLF